MADAPVKVEIAELAAEYHRVVYQYAYRLTGSVQDSEDLTQHTFLVAQAQLHRLRDPGSVRSWLFTILRNRFLKDKKRNRPALAADVELNIEAIADVPLHNKVDETQLQEALNRLPEASRVVLVMFYFEGCSYQEIAAQLGVPMGTVMSRLARAKAYLRTALFDLERVKPKPSKADIAGTSKQSAGTA
jgi:RNA polymerase sigma-70 factor (ECF subfamily)